MEKPPAADKSPVFLIPAVGKSTHYGQKSDFPDFYRRKSHPTTGKSPILPFFSVENPVSLRVKMTELYFLPYKATKVYGPRTEISCFGRSEIPISTGQHAILQISAAEASPVHWKTSEPESGPSFQIACGDGRAGFKPERFSYAPISK